MKKFSPYFTVYIIAYLQMMGFNLIHVCKTVQPTSGQVWEFLIPNTNTHFNMELSTWEGSKGHNR